MRRPIRQVWYHVKLCNVQNLLRHVSVNIVDQERVHYRRTNPFSGKTCFALLGCQAKWSNSMTPEALAHCKHYGVTTQSPRRQYMICVGETFVFSNVFSCVCFLVSWLNLYTYDRRAKLMTGGVCIGCVFLMRVGRVRKVSVCKVEWHFFR